MWEVQSKKHAEKVSSKMLIRTLRRIAISLNKKHKKSFKYINSKVLKEDLKYIKKEDLRYHKEYLDDLKTADLAAAKLKKT